MDYITLLRIISYKKKLRLHWTIWVNDLTLNIDKTNIINSAQNITEMKHLINYQNNSIQESTVFWILRVKIMQTHKLEESYKSYYT
jgi:hypothetical protein